MPDWQKLVEQRLAALSLEPDEKDEVLAELAGHLAETYDSLHKNGVPEEEAIYRTLSQVPDWKDLRRNIRSARKENTMNNRVTRFWFPSLITFVISTSLLAAVQKFGPQPLILHLPKSPVIMFYVFWLLSLPLIGAMGAYLSHNAGASFRQMLIASVFPVLPFVAAFVIILPVSLIIDRHVAHNIAVAGALVTAFSWILVPGVALLAGGLLAVFLSRRSVSRTVSVG
jgi:hypothetical protein